MTAFSDSGVLSHKCYPAPFAVARCLFATVYCSIAPLGPSESAERSVMRRVKMGHSLRHESVLECHAQLPANSTKNWFQAGEALERIPGRVSPGNGPRFQSRSSTTSELWLCRDIVHQSVMSYPSAETWQEWRNTKRSQAFDGGRVVVGQFNIRHGEFSWNFVEKTPPLPRRFT